MNPITACIHDNPTAEPAAIADRFGIPVDQAASRQETMLRFLASSQGQAADDWWPIYLEWLAQDAAGDRGEGQGRPVVIQAQPPQQKARRRKPCRPCGGGKVR